MSDQMPVRFQRNKALSTLGPAAPGLSPPGLSPPAPRQGPSPLRPAQRTCYDALSLALQEGHVFAALTGPAGSGKTTVLEAVLDGRPGCSIRCVRIDEPDRVTAALSAQIEQVATTEAGKPGNRDRHTVLAIDNAQACSAWLLDCLVRLTDLHAPGCRVPQILLVGTPTLWTRLAAPEYAPLLRRVAVRVALPEAGLDEDPWTAVEQDVQRTLSAGATVQAPGGEPQLGSGPADPAACGYDEAELLNAAPADDPAVLPASRFALFPDEPLGAGLLPSMLWPARSRWRPLLLVPATGLVLAVTVILAFDDVPVPLDRPSRPVPVSSARSSPTLPAPVPTSLPTSLHGAAHPAAHAASAAAPAAAAVVPAPILALLLRRGDEQAGLGDVSAARRLYERAAEAGSALAALRLAQTYDPTFLPAVGAGVLADPSAARDLYAQAVALGSKDAAARLQTLNRGP